MTPEELRTFAIFASLSPEQAQSLCRKCREGRAHRGKRLFLQGDPAHYLYLILEGHVKMERTDPDGSVTIVEVLGPKNVLAAANFVRLDPYPVTAVASEDVRYAYLSYPDFEEAVLQEPRIALALLAYMAQRVHRAYASHRPASRAEARLAASLLRAAREHEGEPVRLSHDDLAALSGIARETVTRHLRTWEERGWVELGTRSIRVLDPSSLRALLGESP